MGVISVLTLSDETLEGHLKQLETMLTHKNPNSEPNIPSQSELSSSIEYILKALRPQIGIINCSICFEPIKQDTVMIGMNCDHQYCISCTESNMACNNQDGVGTMTCPLRCPGIYSNQEHMDMFQKVKKEVASESTNNQNGQPVPMTNEEKLEDKIQNGLVKLDIITGTDDMKYEIPVEGPNATNRKRDSNQDKKKVFTIYLIKTLLSQLGFQWIDVNKGRNKDLSLICHGKDKVWVRKMS